jgi:hypothetical protein
MTTPTPEPLTTSVDSAVLDDLRRRADGRDELRQAVANRLSVPVDAPLAAIMSRLDEVINEVNERPAEPPEGTELVDKPTLDQLREDAEVGRTHRE